MTNALLQYFNGNDLAASAWATKYLQEGETTPDDRHKTEAKEFYRIDVKYQKQELGIRPPIWDSLSHYGKHREPLTEESIYQMMKDLKYMLPQGSITAQLGTDKLGSLSNCFVVGQPYDSIGGIMYKDQELAQLMKRRGGVGISIDTLRPEDTATTNAASTSTGATSFMHRYSNTTREIAQNGRRGALMITINVNHPDILSFIKMKRNDDQVTGANISVQLGNEFMKAVEKDEDYLLRFPVDLPVNPPFWNSNYEGIKVETAYHPVFDGEFEYNKLYDLGEGKYVKKVKAREVWDELIESAHGYAEPGLMFIDRHHNYSPDSVYPQFKGITTNPCGEIFMQAYDACRLIAMNLNAFVLHPFTDEVAFDYDSFYKYNYEAMRIADNVVDLELEAIEKIINKIDNDPEPIEVKKIESDLWKKVYTTAKASRRTGLGYTGLADVLAAMGIAYDSPEGLQVVENIGYKKMESEFDCSIDMAITRGTFEGWDRDKEFDTYGTLVTGKNDWYEFFSTIFTPQALRMAQYGRRNVSPSTQAPVGTKSLVAKGVDKEHGTTSGIEPLFMGHYDRFKKGNPGDEGFRCDRTDDNGDQWMKFKVIHGPFLDWLRMGDTSPIHPDDRESEVAHIDQFDDATLDSFFTASPWAGSTAPEIDWISRIKVQAKIQEFITHSISSTINLPSNVSKEKVSEIYMESWKQGLKGITVYREGSRTGVMVSSSVNENKEDEIIETQAPKRPKVLPSQVHKTSVKGTEYLVVVGLLKGKPFEVFAQQNHWNIKGNHLEADTVKMRSGVYNVIIKDDLTIENFTSDMEAIEEDLTRGYSFGLRHGGNIKYAVEQLEKSNSSIVDFSKAIARVLKRYIPDGTQSSIKCSDCGGSNVHFQEGCLTCMDCGSSKCG